MTDKRPFPLPTGYFAIPLGLSALSLAWLHMGDTLSFSRNVSDIIGITAVSVWALFILLYIYKMIYFCLLYTYYHLADGLLGNVATLVVGVIVGAIACAIVLPAMKLFGKH